MIIFKCKMCGGTLEVNNNETVGICEYCGTRQTLPKLDNERKSNLYDRANHFRRNDEFDKAMSIYEQILNEDRTDAESYWSIVLCRYGIEYVEDPTTRKRIPTVNRTQLTSIFDDEDYKSALKYADTYQRELYESEANTINEIQKGILAISQKEEPFDVFICYKETDKSGRRTQDSVLAQELYYELIEEGFKVFFAKITLEDKLGQEYEPYIFAALNSAKVMVVLGTKPEHFNAVWVKNEWSRYLALIKKGENKMLIPAYRDMDPYDLPEEFSHLQAQDMEKLGFMQDLVRGIKKIVSVDGTSTNKETVVVQSAVSGNASALVKRGFLALEDGEWVKADEFFEQALNQNAEDAQAYLGKLMAELQVRTRSTLKDCVETFDNRNLYQKVIRFGDENLKSELNGYISFITDRNETERLKRTYAKATLQMNTAITEEGFEAAAATFNEIQDYKDSSQKANECAVKIQELKHKAEEERIQRERQAEEEKIEQERERVEKERQAEIEKIEKQKRKKRNIYIAVTAGILIIVITILFKLVILPPVNYNLALKCIEEGTYEKAYSCLVSAGDYRDSAELRKDFVILPGVVEIDGYNPLLKTDAYKDEYIYDENGNCIKVVRTWDDGAHGRWTTIDNIYSYDDYGRCVKKVEKVDGQIEDTIEYIYNSNENIIEEKASNNDDYTWNVYYNYDNNENCIEEIHQSSTGNTTEIIKYTYDSSGRCTKEVRTGVYDSKSKIEQVYGSNGKCIKRIYSDEYDTVTTKCSYDRNGNLAKETSREQYGYNAVYSDYQYFYQPKSNK